MADGTAEDESCRGYLLFDGNSRFFFPEATFDETFTRPTDLKTSSHVGFKPDYANRHRIDSFLCEHEYYNAKSLWWPESCFVVLGTYRIDVDAFLKQ